MNHGHGAATVTKGRRHGITNTRETATPEKATTNNREVPRDTPSETNRNQMQLSSPPRGDNARGARMGHNHAGNRIRTHP